MIYGSSMKKWSTNEIDTEIHLYFWNKVIHNFVFLLLKKVKEDNTQVFIIAKEMF